MGPTDFPLHFGETVRVGTKDDGVNLTFVEVRADRRCRVSDTFPCVLAAGCDGTPTATVVLEAATETVREPRVFEIPACGGAIGGSQGFSSLSLNVYLLSPQVETSAPIPSEEYFVRVRVTRPPGR